MGLKAGYSGGCWRVSMENAGQLSGEQIEQLLEASQEIEFKGRNGVGIYQWITVYQRHRFASRFTRGDLELLEGVDEAHETRSGAATKRILSREYERYKHQEYERLASISIAHIYNLRSRRHNRECFMSYTKTRPVKVAIGELRRPQPNGKPGYLRVDMVHQGDRDGINSVYYINPMDEVTHWHTRHNDSHSLADHQNEQPSPNRLRRAP